MSDFVFATWDGGGNVPPAVGIARVLQRMGHRVRFLGHETQREALTGAGFAFSPYAGSRAFSSTATNSPLRVISLFSDRQMGADLLAELDREPADVVVVDCLLLGVLRACSDSGQPHVSLEHLFDGYLRERWARGPMGLGARLHGLRAGDLWASADACLAATSPTLDPGSRKLRRGSLHFTGPVVDLPSTGDRPSHDPAVLVSLSTYRYAGMTEALQRILDATAGLDARVVVTTGPVVDPADLRPAPNHEVHRYLPHDEVMPQVDLVVGHGGHATTMRALANGLPLIVLPMHPMLDQPMVGKAVAGAGAGVLLAKRTPVDRLREQIVAHLADGPHREAAARLGAEIRGMDGARAAADHVLGLVSNGAPAAAG